MIKRIGGAIRHPTNRSLDDFQAYWAEHHGPLFAYTANVQRYVQHITLQAAYGGQPAPTHDGASMFWYDNFESMIHPPPSPRLIDAIPESDRDVYDWYVRSQRYGPADQLTLAETVTLDDRQLFDRSTTWPTAHRRISVVATERTVFEGATTSDMVKALIVVSRKPGLTIVEFQQHWFGVHAQLVASLPGLRRYIQNHALLEAETVRPNTHDGFAELWFDDLASLHRALASPESQAVSDDASSLYAEPVGLVIARERVQKDALGG